MFDHQPLTDRRQPGSSRNINKSSHPQPKKLWNRRNKSKENCIFAPRPYEEIYSERAYLSSAIQDYSSKLAGYIREYSILENKLQQGATGKARRKLRKKVGLMRTRIDEASQQERAIFNRLGDLFLELHSRDIWNAAYSEGLDWPETIQPQIESPCVSASSSASSHGSILSLNPESPVFVPGDKPDIHYDGSCGYRRVTSLGTVPELVQEEEEEEEEEEDRSALVSIHVGEEVPSGYVEQPLEDTAVAVEERVASSTPGLNGLQKDAAASAWRYLHVLADDGDLAQEEISNKRWSLPVMRYTWPT